MTNTINNVPLRPGLQAIRDKCKAIAELAKTLSAPSPAGVDGWVRNFKTREGYDVWDKLCAIPKFGFLIGPSGGVVKVADIGNWIDRDEAQSVVDEAQCEVNLLRHEASAAQAIIDGLLGDVAAQEETANQWRELALQFDRHRMTAMAHIRAAASGDKSAIEALGVFAALPPIPGHEITAERDELLAEVARRGVKYMELAGKYDLACGRRDKLTGLLRMIASRGLSPLLTEHELEQIDAALAELAE